MPSKKAIIVSILLKELIAIRTDTLWRMLYYLHNVQLPGKNEEGATVKLDNKGAIFIPGGLIYQDVDESQISYEPLGVLNETRFQVLGIGRFGEFSTFSLERLNRQLIR